MRWSLRLGSFRGIEVSVHVTFLLLLAFLGLNTWFVTRSIEIAVRGVVFIFLLFACVLLHEFGHALTAARFGIRTRDIVLYPIGGVARLERMPRTPRRELLVALAGPAVNVVIAAGLLAWLWLSGTAAAGGALDWARGPLVQRLMVVNVILVLFNLIPAFPMDGGRVLRALLAMRLEYARATRIAAVVGQSLALLFGFVGLFWNPFLLFIAFFVWIGAAQEASMVQTRSVLDGVPLLRVMQTGGESIGEDDRLLRAVLMTLDTDQKDFPVVAGDRVVGVLRQEDMLRGLHDHGGDAPVGSVMQREYVTAHVDEAIEPVLRRLTECRCKTVPVIDHAGRLMGVVTLENVGEYLRIQAALKR